MPELCCAVALAQTENIDELVQRRIDVAKTFSNAAEQFRAWFVPQEVPDYCEHSADLGNQVECGKYFMG